MQCGCLKLVFEGAWRSGRENPDVDVRGVELSFQAMAPMRDGRHPPRHPGGKAP